MFEPQTTKLTQQNGDIGVHRAKKEGEWGDRAGGKWESILCGIISFVFLSHTREICMDIRKDTSFDGMENINKDKRDK